MITVTLHNSMGSQGLKGFKGSMFGPSDSPPLSLSLHGHCPSISLSLCLSLPVSQTHSASNFPFSLSPGLHPLPSATSTAFSVL